MTGKSFYDIIISIYYCCGVNILNSILADLVELSHFYGRNKEFVISGGGNTSYKTEDKLFIKASGIALGGIDETGFCVMNRKMVKIVMKGEYSNDPFEREAQIKEKLLNSRVYPERKKRPSVETSLHEMINYAYICHTHSTKINAVLCSVNAKRYIEDLFGDDVIFIEYCDPGYTLAKKVQTYLINYRVAKKSDPHIIFLENHGVFVAANSTSEINKIYDEILSKIKLLIKKELDIESLKISLQSRNLTKMILKELYNQDLLGKFRYNTLIKLYTNSMDDFTKIITPVTPDIIVYCKAGPLFINDNESNESIMKELIMNMEKYKNIWGYNPKIILIKGIGMLAIETNEYSVDVALDMFEDFMKICFYAENFGGLKFLSNKHIKFIDTWEVENYRRSILKK